MLTTHTQMPVVDGWASTRMIREHEHKNPMPSHAVLSCGRTPIFAISGMLRRGDQKRYADSGFDGWMPKPIDLRRLATYLAGAWDPVARSRGTYDDGQFELGGWFPAQELTPTLAPGPPEVGLEVYPPLPETPATQGYQIWENAQTEAPSLPHGAEGVPEPVLPSTLDDKIAPEEVPCEGRRSSRAGATPRPDGEGETAPGTPGTPFWPPIASPWRLD
jgi:CheY-like chemotaxis protein